MIEVIYKEEGKREEDGPGFRDLPRNVRQIGVAGDSFRVYLEDYVYTFLWRISQEEGEKKTERGCAALLVGERQEREGTVFLFIKGAVMAQDMEVSAEHIDFLPEDWTRMLQEKEQYFPEQEIAGWFFSQPQITMEMTETLKRAHQKHFGGDRILILMEPLEREEALFRCENNQMIRQNGYYIYYEKNTEMQTYMVDKNKEERSRLEEKTDDEAVKIFRRIISGKKQAAKGTHTDAMAAKEAHVETKTAKGAHVDAKTAKGVHTDIKTAKEDSAGGTDTEEKTYGSVFSYAATACLAIAILTVGIHFYQDYREIQSQQMRSESTSAQMVSSKETAGTGAGISVTPEALQTPTAAPQTPATQTPAVQNTGANNTGVQNTGVQNTGGQTNSAAGSASGQSMQSAADSIADAQNSSIYQEESDVRKAKRREALEGQAEADGSTQTSASGQTHATYVVRPGDTLYQIGIEKYGTIDIVKEICDLNGISEEELIYPGQILALP